MATALSSGHFYILNWKETDMDTVDLEDGTVGEDFLVGAIPNWRSASPLDFDKELFHGGEGYGIRYNSIERMLMVNLKVTKAQHEKVWEYHYRRQSAKTSKDYAAWKWSAGTYYPFFNKDGTTKREYCEGFLTDVVDIWFDSESNLFELLIVFEEVLSG